MTELPKGRALARHETHDLGMIIKERAKVLISHVASQKAAMLADFEQKIAAVYSFDQDAVWQEAMQIATEAAKKAQEMVAQRCEERGIPKPFAPGLQVYWHGRGENAVKERRDELRRVAKAQIEAMGAAAEVKINQEALDLRTQVVAMGLLSDAAAEFLQSLAPVERSMQQLNLQDIEKKLTEEQAARRKRIGGGYH